MPGSSIALRLDAETGNKNTFTYRRNLKHWFVVSSVMSFRQEMSCPENLVVELPVRSGGSLVRRVIANDRSLDEALNV
jgi:hypothetical protein